MSRVAVVTSSPPSSAGGHLVIARALATALRCGGHDADLVLTPSHRFGRQASAYVATWLTNVAVDRAGRPVDHVISLRYPSYAVRHPSHVCWLNHRMREYYDLWPALYSTLGTAGRAKEQVRRFCLHRVDRYLLLHNVRQVYAQSRTIQRRLERMGGIPSRVLYPPAPDRPYRCDEYGDYLFAVSRLTALKRMDLVIAALAEPAARHVRCVIAGEGEQGDRLSAMIRDLGIERRVTLVGEVGSDELVRYLAGCRGVVFVPRDEDYGFVTIEAFASAKAVVTCGDSGGPTELVEDGVNGFVCEPTPTALSAAIARLADDQLLAERLGAAGARRAATITWPAAVETLLSA